MFWTDGSFYKGEWKGGVQNGKGQIYITGSEVISGLFENSILVQIIPSLYEKQMEISSQGIQDLFGSTPKLPSTQKTKTYSESKHPSSHARKKLAKIDEHDRKKGTIKDNVFFQSPERHGRSQHIGHPNTHIHPARLNNPIATPSNRMRNQIRSHHNHQHHHASHSY